MALHRCRKCGLPRKLARGFSWPGDGTILARGDPRMRMIFIEADYLCNLWSELDGMLDISVTDAVLKGQHMAVRAYQQESVLPGWRRYAVRHLPARLISRLTAGEVALYGIGALEIIEYRRGKMMVVRVRYPYDIFSVAGGVRVVSESIEGREAEVAWSREDGDYVITLAFKPAETGEGEEESKTGIEEDRGKPVVRTAAEPASAGQGEGERCTSCGLPLVLRELRWRAWEGTIVHRHRENRYVFFSGYVLSRIFDELERKSGRELAPHLFDISMDFTRQHMRHMPVGDKDDIYRAFSRDIFMRGMGKVLEMARGESHLEMAIRNPYYPPLLAGSVGGIFERVEGELAVVDYHLPIPELLELRARAA